MQLQPQGKVLVVDDEPRNVRLMEGVLLNAGYEVITAPCGREALAQVESQLPDIVLLDIMMPEMDGFEVCRRLKADENTMFLPVVMVTELDELEDRVRALEAGADDFLTKPVDESELLARVKSLIRMKRLHDALQKSYEDLRELEALREHLTHMIVHDMRTPLMAVMGGLQLMELSGQISPPAQGRDHFEMVCKGAETILSMTNDLLDITKMECGKMKLDLADVSVSQVVAAAEGGLQALAAKGELHLSFQVPADLPSVRADPEVLRRVLVNLVGNSLKFTPPGGQVRVTAAPIADGSRQAAGKPPDMSHPPTAVQVSVADTGPGIPPEHHDTIFEKFGQVEARSTYQRSSTGLGLTFCKMAIEVHGGRIWVESEEGKGSTFSFTVPIADG